MSRRRPLAALAGLVATLALAPSAFAAPQNFVVDDPDGTADAVADGTCNAPGADTCTLPEAILESNANVDDDTITLSVSPGSTTPLVDALPVVTDRVLIDGQGHSVSFGATATGFGLDVAAADSTVRSITFRGGAPNSTAVVASGAAIQLASVSVVDGGGDGVRASGTGVRLDSVRVHNVAGAGVYVPGANVTITAPDILGSGGDGLALSGDGASVSGGAIRGNGANGVTIAGQNDTVSRVTLYSNGGRPVAVLPGANGGIQPPQNLRIGPRRADGSLPLTGTANGTVELWSGDPSSASTPSFFDSIAAGGDFTYGFPSEPAPGSVFSAMTINGGSSEFATVAVPSDVVSPEVIQARAVDTENVRVIPTEPIDAASVQKEDFGPLTMAGVDRPISSVSVAIDGSYITLASSGWKEGEAGYVQIASAGAFTDQVGNQSQTAPRLRVLAAPGDFRAPLGANLKIAPKSICLTRGRRCRRPGMTIRFETPEAGKATIVVKRGNKEVGRRTYGNIKVGVNRLKFNGRLNARKLRAGRYRFLLYLHDMVGNVTDQPPITLFNVRRTTR